MKTRAVFLSALLLSLILILAGCSANPTATTPTASQPAATAVADPLPSWNDGPAKQAILDFVKTTTDKSNPKFVPPETASQPSIRTARRGSSSPSTRKCYSCSTV